MGPPRPPAPSSSIVRPGLKRSLLLNVLALGGLWVVYSAVRTLTADSWRAARGNAHRLIDFQEQVGLPSEAVLQGLFLPYEWLTRAANTYYFAAHFPSMILFLAWALLFKRHAMPRIRFALIACTMAGLVVHLAFPLAPPRMLRMAGFVDTARLFGPDPYALGIAKAANELAAMPSLHVGWALLIAVAVIKVGISRLRWLVIAHPVLTAVVVVVTANHYWTDIFAGALLAWVGWWGAGRFHPIVREPDVIDLTDLGERAQPATTVGDIDLEEPVAV